MSDALETQAEVVDRASSPAAIDHLLSDSGLATFADATDSSLAPAVVNEDQRALSVVTSLPGRKEVERLEAELLQMPQAHIPVEHLFGDGVYVRKILIPKGAIATGRIHKFDHVSVVISGDMTVWTEGAGVHRVTGPSITEVKAGTKRAGYAHEDTLWLTAHRMDRLDEAEIVEFLTVGSYEEYEEFCRQLAEKRIGS